MEDKKKKPSKSKDYLSLVKKLYREEGIRPLSKAMTRASKLWEGVKLKKPKI